MTTQAHSSSTAHDEAHEHHIVPLSVYYKVFAALMVGLILTVAVALFDFTHLGEQWAWLNIVCAMVIAVGKALLVILFFMHIKFSSRLTQFFAGAALIWLAIFFIFIFADYYSRDWQQVPDPWKIPGQAYVVDNPAVDLGRPEPRMRVQPGAADAANGAEATGGAESAGAEAEAAGAAPVHE